MEETNTKVKKSVRIKLQKEDAQRIKEENQGQQGQAFARLRNVPTPPRKMRLVANMIRGLRVLEAMNILRFEAKVGATYMDKLLRSAIANWQEKNQDIDVEDADLYIREVYVDAGRTLKRLRPAPQGRGHRIRKRSNHISMVVDSLKQAESFEETINESEEENQDS